jgi:hypothetical protein
MRPDAHRFIRPDAYRFMPPGSPRYHGKDVVSYIWPVAATDQAPQASGRKDCSYQEPPADLDVELERVRLALRHEIAKLRLDWELFKFALKGQKAFNPAQPRVPKGNTDGGQWTDEDGQAGRIQLAQLGGALTDADGTPYYKPGGHHEMPKGIYRNWTHRPETREVFDKATTGKVPQMLLRTTPEGVPEGHFWHGQGGAHRKYNEAVDDLSKRFLRDNNITP